MYSFGGRPAAERVRLGGRCHLVLTPHTLYGCRRNYECMDKAEKGRDVVGVAVKEGAWIEMASFGSNILTFPLRRLRCVEAGMAVVLPVRTACLRQDNEPHANGRTYGCRTRCTPSRTIARARLGHVQAMRHSPSQQCSIEILYVAVSGQTIHTARRLASRRRIESKPTASHGLRAARNATPPPTRCVCVGERLSSCPRTQTRR